MSLCLRTFPNKFTSFVNTRKQVTKIDRHLPKHVKSSLFLEKFLGTQTPASVTNYVERSLNSTIYPLNQNLLINHFDQTIEWPAILHKRCNWNEQQIMWLQNQKQKNVQKSNIPYHNMQEAVVNNNMQWLELCIDSNCFYKDNKSCLSYPELLSVNRTSNTTLSDSEKQSILYSEVSPNVQNTEKQLSEDRKPSESQLKDVFDCLSKDLPHLFISTMNYSIYTEDLLFVNNIRGITTKGIANYFKQIALLRIVGHLKFAYVKLDILKITMHPEDNSVKVRWRIVGISATHVLLSFWKMNVFKMKEYINDRESWYDGFSTFYVNTDGKVFKHVVDKMMPDEECEKVKTPVEAKLALFAALLGLDSYNCTKLCSKVRSQLTEMK